MIRAVALTECINQALTSSWVNLTWGSMMVISDHRDAVILALLTVYHRFMLQTTPMRVWIKAPFYNRCAK